MRILIPGSLVTVPEVRDEVIICKGLDDLCEAFDGVTSIKVPSTKTNHQNACMALYRNQATIIAGATTASVETLTVSGWILEQSHPSAQANENMHQHACISIDDGIITTGGYDGASWLKSVYFLKNKEWMLVGELSNTFRLGSMMIVEGAFLVFGGYNNSNMVERVEWDGEKVVSTRNITNNGGNCIRPILFYTEFDTCNNFCSDNFCYN